MNDDLDAEIWNEFPQCPQCDAPLLYGIEDSDSPYGFLKCARCEWCIDAYDETECEIQDKLVSRALWEHRGWNEEAE